MKQLFIPNPGPQTEFLQRPEYIVGYGGAVGGGKSTAGRHFAMYILDFEEQRVKRGEIARSSAWCAYFRRVYPNLKHTEAIMLREMTLIDPGAKYNAADKIWRFSCGMHYQLGAMEKPHDWLKWNGTELTYSFFDELTEMEEEQFDGIDTRMRTSDDALKRWVSIRWASNPVGSGLLWVRKRFIEPAPPRTTIRRVVTLEDGSKRNIDSIFIPAFLRDNPYLSKDGKYEASIRANKPHLIKALLEGDWYASVDGILSNLWQNDLHVCENAGGRGQSPLPLGTFRFRSGDFGINDWASYTWWYVDRDGAMTAYYHLYLRGLNASQQADRIREVERWFGDWDEEDNCTMLKRSPLDAQCFKQNGTSGPSIAQEFRSKGVFWIKSIKDRVNGLAEVAKRLGTMVRNEDGSLKLFDGKPRPMLRYMKRCEKPVSLLPILPRDPNNPEDVPPRCEDHVLDDLMYACGSQPLRPELKLVRDPYEDDSEEESAYRRKFAKRGFGHLR